MRTWIIAVCLCLFFFIIPLQCFILGNGNGLGIQAAVYRWQATSEGTLLIPITREVTYVTEGTYTGKTIFSVILWTAGTVTLALCTLSTLIFWNDLPSSYFRPLMIGLFLSGTLFTASCIVQYGILLNGPAGVSLPFGIVGLFVFTGFTCWFQDLFYQEGSVTELLLRSG